MKSFTDVLNVLANSHYDMRVLVSKWQEMLSPDPANVEFKFFDGTTFVIENFASIRKNIEDAISNYGNVAMMTATDASSLKYNDGTLVVGNGSGPYTLHKSDEFHGYGVSNGVIDGSDKQFGLNPAQAWGCVNAGGYYHNIVGTEAWGIDSDRVMGARFEVTGTGVFKRASNTTMGVWANPNSVTIRGQTPSAYAQISHDGIRGENSQKKAWGYGIPESNYLNSVMRQWADGTFSEADEVTRCLNLQPQINQLKNVQLIPMSIKLTKVNSLTSLHKIGDTFPVEDNNNIRIILPGMFADTEAKRLSRIQSATLILNYNTERDWAGYYGNYKKSHFGNVTFAPDRFTVVKQTGDGEKGKTPEDYSVMEFAGFSGNGNGFAVTKDEAFFSGDVYLFLQYIVFDKPGDTSENAKADDDGEAVDYTEDSENADDGDDSGGP